MRPQKLGPRKPDEWGSGHFGASRGGRTHRGIDLIIEPGEAVSSPVTGKVTKIGYPYADPNKRHIRYVQVTAGDYDFRVFYVSPSVKIGQQILAGTPIGFSQDLGEFYPGITPHIHLEIKHKGVYVDPTPVVLAG